jgi:hypothetical protein
MGKTLLRFAKPVDPLIVTYYNFGALWSGSGVRG